VVMRLGQKVTKAREMGSYRLVTLLGKGGMGEVWRARHHMLARDAAIKVIQPDVLSNKSGNSAVLLRRRFEQEAKATALLRSPHTVELYDFGVTKDGAFYYVMELLDGIDLETLVKKVWAAASGANREYPAPGVPVAGGRSQPRHDSSRHQAH
jgi:serine/threonine protein kinase